MLSYILRRILLMFPTVFGITLLVFLVMRLSPGGVAGAVMSAAGNMKPEEAKARLAYYNRVFGLKKPWYVQYGRWLNRASPVGFHTYEEGDADLAAAEKEAADEFAKMPPGSEKPEPKISVGEVNFSRPALKWPDLGHSILRNQSVGSLIQERLPTTLLLEVLTIPFIYAIAITTGIYAAKHRGKAFDVGSGTVLLALWSIPTMWAGVMMIGYLANKDYLHWFPTSGLHDSLADNMAFWPHWKITEAGRSLQAGWLLDFAWHLVLPVLCLTYNGFAFLAKLMRASVLENLSADFARTARAKGLAENVVLWRHVFRNSLLPLITIAAALLPALLGGALIIEVIFSIRGMGQLTVDAIKQSDQNIVLGVTLVVGVITVVSQLLADILYALADPRISYE